MLGELQKIVGRELEKHAEKALGDALGKLGVSGKMPGAVDDSEKPPVVPFASDCSGQKKAVFIGINYFGTKAELFGCCNDVKNVKAFITQAYGFQEANIRTLTDEKGSGNELPTRANIIAALQWLAAGAKAGDSLFLHYSGHGGTARDTDGDEVDGFDETILPADFDKSGQILDDEIHAVLVAPLPKGVRLTAVFDSCHSGSVLDLPWSYKIDGSLEVVLVDNRKAVAQAILQGGMAFLSGDKQRALGHGIEAVKALLRPGGNDEARKKAERERTSEADVVQFSGCLDDQTSADVKMNGTATGAASFALLACLRAQPRQTYTELLKGMRAQLAGKYTQVPQISTAHPIDLQVAFTM